MRRCLLLCLLPLVPPAAAQPLIQPQGFRPAALSSSARTIGAATAVAPHSEWRKYCSDYENSGVAQSGGAISPFTAGQLRTSWSVTLGGPIASSPTISGDTVYVGDWSGFESAIDITNGDVMAMADLGTTTAPQCQPSTIGITSAATSTGDTIFLAGGDDAFYALDASTLGVKWRRTLGDNSATGGYYGWCSPTYVAGRLLQGVSSNCDSPFVQGALVALDANSGDIMSEAFTVTPDWPHNDSGAGVWTSPAVDLVRQKIFVTTGSAMSIDDGHTDSIVRIALGDMTIEDSWKIQADIEDADWGSSPTLFTDANGQQLVGAGQKDGGYYAFNRDDLQSGPVWKAQLAHPGACPFCGDGILSTAAFDGSRLYVGSGKPPNGVSDALGAFTALDPTTGLVIWQTSVANPVIAPVSYANGVVFGVSGNHVYALDAATGTILWTGYTKATCVGGVAITDRGIFLGDMSGTLYSWSIPTTQPSRTRAVRP
jgi:polyvinyl alcohol dehydrogenase (cytochrome)